MTGSRISTSSRQAVKSGPPTLPSTPRTDLPFHERAKEAFFQAASLGARERAAYLGVSCDGDAQLRREVESLLAHHEEDNAPPGQSEDGADAEVGSAFFAGRYRLIRLVGEGGMGSVHEAHDELLGVTVALKRLHGRGPLIGRLLLEEARLARLVTHPAVCRVYDVGEHDSECFLTMEYVDGEDLRGCINREGPLPAARVVEIGRTLCEALAAAHAAGVIHRDLKPSNILLDAKGGIRITDFGIAAGTSSGHRSAAGGGSPAYMAPEQGQPGAQVDERADLYALGLVLYEALTARRAFSADTVQELLELQRTVPPVPPSTLVHGLAPELEAIVLEALAKDPENRPASAGVMGARLGALAGEPIPAKAPGPTRRLPRIATSFIGRRGEISRIGEHLAQGALLTLTGPGGVGKTRLALAAAETILDRFWDGACYVDLSSVEPGEDMAEAVARALSVPRQPEEPAGGAVLRLLAPRSLLLILDCCERVRSSVAAFTGSVLALCPEVRILATSREPLGALDERLLRIAPLPVPGATGVASVLASDGARLFLDRALQAAPVFVLNKENAEAVARLVHRLDGLPLALELAAACMRRIPIATLAARVEQDLEVLASESEALPVRHRSLDGLVRWSHDLLDPEERTLFRRLAVFAGHFDLGTLAAVASFRPLPRERVLDVLGRLVDRSLVCIVGGPGRPRYRLLDTLRAFAADRLAETNEETALRARLLTHHVRLASSARESLREMEAGEGSRRIQPLLDDLRGTLAFAVTSPARAVQGLQVATDIAPEWRWLAAPDEMRKCVEPLLVLAGTRASPLLRSRACSLLGDGENEIYRFASARRYHLRALRLARASRSDRRVAQALRGLGVAARGLGRLAEARTRLEEAVAISRRLKASETLSSCVVSLANLCVESGDLGAARPLYTEALEIAETRGNLIRAATALGNLGVLERRSGNLKEARVLLERSVRIREQLRLSWSRLWMEIELGQLVRDEGDLLAARTALEEALATARRVEHAAFELHALTGLVVVYRDLGERAHEARAFRDGLVSARSLGALLDLVRMLEGSAELIASSDPSLAARILGSTARSRVRTGCASFVTEARLTARCLDHLTRSLGPRRLRDRLKAGGSTEPEALVDPACAALAALAGDAA